MRKLCRTMTPFHSGTAPYSLQSPSSALKTSMLRVSKSLHVLQHQLTELLIEVDALNPTSVMELVAPKLTVRRVLGSNPLKGAVEVRESDEWRKLLDLSREGATDKRSALLLNACSKQLYVIDYVLARMIVGFCSVYLQRSMTETHVRGVANNLPGALKGLFVYNTGLASIGSSSINLFCETLDDVNWCLVWLYRQPEGIHLGEKNYQNDYWDTTKQGATVIVTCIACLLLDYRKWESCRTMPLVGGFSRGSPVSPVPSFRSRSIFTSITLIGSHDHAKSRLNLFNHSLTPFGTLQNDLQSVDIGNPGRAPWRCVTGWRHVAKVTYDGGEGSHSFRGRQRTHGAHTCRPVGPPSGRERGARQTHPRRSEGKPSQHFLNFMWHLRPISFSPSPTSPQCSRVLRPPSCTVAFAGRVSRHLVHSHHTTLSVVAHPLHRSPGYRTQPEGFYKDCRPSDRCSIYMVVGHHSEISLRAALHRGIFSRILYTCRLPQQGSGGGSVTPATSPLSVILPVDARGMVTRQCVSLPCERGVVEASVAERLARSPPTKVIRAQSPAGPPDFRKWESCWMMSCRWPAAFSVISSFPCPLIPASLYILLNHPHRLSRPRCKEPPKSLLSPLYCCALAASHPARASRSGLSSYMKAASKLNVLNDRRAINPEPRICFRKRADTIILFVARADALDCIEFLRLSEEFSILAVDDGRVKREAREVTSGRKICDCEHQSGEEYDCKMDYWTGCRVLFPLKLVSYDLGEEIFHAWKFLDAPGRRGAAQEQWRSTRSLATAASGASCVNTPGVHKRVWGCVVACSTHSLRATSTADKGGGDRDDTATRITRAIAAKRKLTCSVLVALRVPVGRSAATNRQQTRGGGCIARKSCYAGLLYDSLMGPEGSERIRKEQVEKSPSPATHIHVQGQSV
ncbi:hypothetical protein PR048_005912 [Dryococelus australis]|uniref:Uncharacterized protein n=1 Tax=Dryococelus australis TaxID=614101 RepID=A0ABQ9I9K0_9NEOP|nr:hypothetical protein PR048_005912 [Dryococelus australis]